jgi:hypothetical protein
MDGLSKQAERMSAVQRLSVPMPGAQGALSLSCRSEGMDPPSVSRAEGLATASSGVWVS